MELLAENASRRVKAGVAFYARFTRVHERIGDDAEAGRVCAPSSRSSNRRPNEASRATQGSAGRGRIAVVTARAVSTQLAVGSSPDMLLDHATWVTWRGVAASRRDQRRRGRL